MNKIESHLQKAIESFEQIKGKEFFINPISQVDVEIVKILTDIILKFGVLPIKGIMVNYKYLSDNEFLNELKKVKDSLKDYPNNPTMDALPWWISFKDIDHTNLLRVNIIAFSKKDFVDSEGNSICSILLNETNEGVKNVPIHANRFLIYAEERDRDFDFDSLKNLSNY